MAKYIFVTGGVVSSVGKGVAVASIGRMLKSRGMSVSIQKLDPYPVSYTHLTLPTSDLV